ncbi:ATP-binding protein, partial [Nonomuraea sp. MCN248]
MALAGRTEELTRLHELLDEAVRGAGNAVTIRGIVGCGKTALLHEFAARAAARGIAVLTASGSPAEQALPLGVLGQLFTGVSGVSGDDDPAAPVRRLLDRAMAAVRSETPGDAVEQARIMRELWLTLYARSQDRPLLIGIDDAQHADEASLRYLLYFVRRLSGARIQLVFTEWDHPRRIHPVTDLDLLRQHHCHRLRLAPLTGDQVAAVAAAQLPLPDAERLTPVLHELSGGNPLLVAALIEDARRGQTPPGEAYRMAVLTCLHRGEPAGLRVARAVAALDVPGGPPGPAAEIPELVHQLAGVDPASADHCLDVLNATGVLRAGRFRHPAARQAVLADLDADDRARLRAEAAASLYARGAAKAVVAEH